MTKKTIASIAFGSAALAGIGAAPIIPIKVICPAAHEDYTYFTDSGAAIPRYDPTKYYLTGQPSSITVGGGSTTPTTISLTHVSASTTDIVYEAFCNDGNVVRNVPITPSEYSGMGQKDAPILQKTVDQSLFQSVVVQTL